MDFLLKQNLLLIVRAMYFCVEEHWAELGRKYLITPAQQHVLFLLYTSSEKSLSPSQLSEYGCWHISTVTRLIKPLESKALIEVLPDKRPKYKVVKLTESGTNMIERLIMAVNEMPFFPFDINPLSENEIGQFLQSAERILEANRSKEFSNWISRVKTGSY
ncbi:MarR family winged helix-turn-helix transcriptional regulator [Falsibacillus pallidus]|uniref:DNA-binding MarR family transcriptional regulator n=1 Tax=Falsibacillus pallidus TaxID=493781 RepID=A0A370GX05_9BACI|nr:MarR family transcriptional regulator [Falsibacillus pallidus]RDI48009.1 DNA-binding MarR family transcriptional regulator [Falsibacillus pallidus]